MILWLVLTAAAGLIVGILIERGRADKSALAASGSNRTGSNRPVQLVLDQRLEEAVRGLPLGLVLADEGGEIIYQNEFVNNFAHGPLTTEALVEGHIQDLLAVAASGQATQKNFEIFGPPRRELRFRAAPVLTDSARSGAVVIVTDITQEQLIDEVRRDFVANVSHELKTPVGAMSVLADAILMSDDPEQIAGLTERIQQAALRLGDTVDDLLTLSTIETGEAFESEVLNVDALVDMSLDGCREVAMDRKVGLRAPDAASNALVDGDRVQLTSAITNLITNAIKYTEEGGEVAISVVETENMVKIAVADTGVGIPQADLQRIFERFYRVDAARSRASGGTGLGLSIVRHVALNHGGRVDVSSEEGKGSTFVLELPKSPA